MKTIHLAAFCIVAVATSLAAAEPRGLATLKKEYAQNAHPDEAARVNYVRMLADLRATQAKHNGNWQAVDAELRKHPAPKDANSAAYTKLRIGEWTSPRHGYVYRKDGTWSMTPVEPGATHGKWKIAGNQYFDGAGADMTKYTIILLTSKDFIFTDGQVVFFEKRGRG